MIGEVDRAAEAAVDDKSARGIKVILTDCVDGQGVTGRRLPGDGCTGAFTVQVQHDRLAAHR